MKQLCLNGKELDLKSLILDKKNYRQRWQEENLKIV